MVTKTSPVQFEIKQFTPELIQLGIEKLKRRITEVQTLDPSKVRYDDAQVKNVEHKINDTIREIFDEKSPQYRDYGHHRIWHGGYNMNDDDVKRQAKFTAGIPQTITILNGLIEVLEEKRIYLGFDPAIRARTAFEGMDLHPRIAGVCRDLYRDGYYPQAVFDGCKALENFVKEKSGRYDLMGADLMRTVFSKNSPILAFNDLKDDTDRVEQEGMMHLFEGVALGIRDPRGHSFLDDSPELALEYIALLSLLANRLEKAKRISGP